MGIYVRGDWGQYGNRQVGVILHYLIGAKLKLKEKRGNKIIEMVNEEKGKEPN